MLTKLHFWLLLFIIFDIRAQVNSHSNEIKEVSV